MRIAERIADSNPVFVPTTDKALSVNFASEPPERDPSAQSVDPVVKLTIPLAKAGNSNSLVASTTVLIHVLSVFAHGRSARIADGVPVRRSTRMACLLLALLVSAAFALDAGAEAAPAHDDADFSQEDGDGVIEPGENADQELLKAVQNPVANLISLPFQNNTNFDFGPRERTQNILNIQPVWPFELNEDWNLITRTIVPIVSQPGFFSGESRETGLGDVNLTAFVAPSEPGKLIWGAGPIVLLPTATDDRLGSDKWGLGPSAVVLTMRGPWVLGALVSNLWSVGGSGNDDINSFTWQYFVTRNLPGGWYVTSSPIINANWEASGSDTWTVPVGGGAGKLLRLGPLPLNAQIQTYYNVAKPDFVGDWSLRLQLQMLFPKFR